MPKQKNQSGKSPPSRPPAKTPEGRMNQLVSSAFDLVEKRILEGTASSQEVTTLIKYGSEEQRLKNEKLQRENDLLVAKDESLKAQERQEEMFKKAIEAFQSYSGNTGGEPND